MSLTPAALKTPRRKEAKKVVAHSPNPNPGSSLRAFA